MYNIWLYLAEITIWKSGIWGCKKNLNIEKIAFKVVQIKVLAMQIMVGNVQNIFIFISNVLLSLLQFWLKLQYSTVN